MTVEIYSAQRSGGGGGGSGNVIGTPPTIVGDVVVFGNVLGTSILDGGMSIAQIIAAAIAGSGNVVGPASATDNALARYDGTTGKLIQDSTALLNDTGQLSVITSVDGSDTLIVKASDNTNRFNFGTFPGSGSLSMMWLGDIVPTVNNYTLFGNGNNNLVFNVPSIFGICSFLFGDTVTTAINMVACRLGIGVQAGVAPSYGLHLKPTLNVNPNQTALFIDDTPSTGSTGIFFNAGAAQSSNPILSVEGSNSIQALGTVKGVITTIANAVTGLIPGVFAATTDATLELTDGTGTVYRIPCKV